MAPQGNMTRNQRLQQMLMAQEQNAPPIQSHSQGLASLLRNFMAGQAGRRDVGDQQAAQEAMMRGLMPTQQAPGVVGPPMAGGIPGSLGKAISGLEGVGGESGRNLQQQLMMQKMVQDYATEQADTARTQGLEDYETKAKIDQQYPTAVSGRPAANIQYGSEIARLRKNVADAGNDPSKLSQATQELQDFQYVMSKDPDAVRKQAYSKGAGAGKADLEIAAPKAELASTGKAVGESNMALYDTVQSGLATVEKAENLIEHLNSSSAITGAGAEVFKGVERLKALMGSDIAAGTVADTEILNAMMGSDVFGMIKSLGIGARGLDTPAEREFMREVLTGTITLNRDTIIKLAEIRRDVGQRAIDRWNDKTERGELNRFYEATGIEKTRLGKPKAEEEMHFDAQGNLIP